MLTSFFDKSSPFNYMLLSLYLVVVLFIQGIMATTEGFDITAILQLLLDGTLLIFSMLLTDFFVRKNALTRSNTFGIFCFSTTVLLFPLAFQMEGFWSLFFVLLGFRRMFSLQSGRNDIRKITDACLWFFVASYFYFWSLLWLIPLYVAITTMKEPRFRYYFIPPITGTGLFLIFTAIQMIMGESFEWIDMWYNEPSLQFKVYGELALLIGITIFFAFFLWSLFYRMALLPEIPKKFRANYILIFFVALTGVLVSLAAPNKTGFELVFMTPGFALVIATFLERNADAWLRETMMWTLLLLPLILPFL